MIDGKELLRRAKMTLAAQINPYRSVERVFPLALDAIQTGESTGYLGVKNVPQIPQSAVEALAGVGFVLHTLDKAALGGRAVDIQLKNPISGRPMTGSSSGTAINVRVCFNDLGLGTDGGGSVLAPAMSVNLYGFISPLICASDLIRYERKSTDDICFRPCLGLMARTWDVLSQGIVALPGMEEVKNGDDSLPILALRITDAGLLDKNGNRQGDVPDRWGPRMPLIAFLKKTLEQCDCLISEEGPVDLDGLGDSIFGHFDARTKAEQTCSGKGLIRVANMAGATAVCVPSKELGRGTVFLCESVPDKIGRMLTLAQTAVGPEDFMLTWYFDNLDQYLDTGALLP